MGVSKRLPTLASHAAVRYDDSPRVEQVLQEAASTVTDTKMATSNIPQRRLLGMLISFVPFGIAAYQLMLFRGLAEQSRIQLQTNGHALPRTQVGSPLALAIVFVAIGCIVLAIAFGKQGAAHNVDR
jgi:hypothetical protein